MKTLMRACLVTASLVIAIGAAELLVRALKADRPVVRLALTQAKIDKFKYDPILGWKNLPNVARAWEGAPVPATMTAPTNAQGFRSAFDYTTARTGKPRVALVGDSQVFGFYVGDSDYLGAVLGKQIPTAEVYSFGVPGYGPPQELLLLKDDVLKYRPDVVVLVIFLDNDLIDTFTPVAYGLVQRPYVAEWNESLRLANIPTPVPLVDRDDASERRYLRPHAALFSGSAMYRLLVHRASVRPHLADVLADWRAVQIETLRPAKPRPGPWGNEGFRLPNGMPPACTFLSRCPPKYRLYGLGAAVAVWAEMKRVCETHGIRLVVLISPPFVDLRDKRGVVSEQVAAALTKEEIGTIRFFDQLLDSPKPSDALAPGLHWTEATTVAAAKAIHGYIAPTLLARSQGR